MPRTKLSEYSTTNSDNTDIESINIAEGCAPSGINNAIRELMVHLKEFQTGASGDAFTFAGGVLISGTANTITGNVLMSGTNTLSGTNSLTGSTSAAFAAGTVSAPSIAAHGDTNTGIFFPAADTIAFTEGGAEAMRIDSSGNVGIGTTSPSTYGKFVAYSSGGYAAIDGNGFVNSAQLLDLASAGGRFTGYSSRGALGAIHIEQATTSADGGYMQFRTSPSGSTTPAERMRIDSSGQVGIGVTPSTWTSYKALQIGTVAGGAGTLAAANRDTYLVTSAYYNSGWKYGTTSVNANFYNQSDGVHTWGYASGAGKTAGDALTWVEAARITSGGQLLIGKTSTSGTVVGSYIDGDGAAVFTRSGTTSGTSTLDVYSTGAGAYRFFVTMDGKINCTSTTIAAISDMRLKENIQDIDVGLDAVMALKPRKFDWKEGKGKNIKGDRGWIAQEFEQVFPEMIGTWKDEPPEGEEPYKSVSADLIPVLTKAIQELKAINDAQTTRIETLETRLTALENK